MSDPKSPEFFANVPVSLPVVVPETEDILMNGFIWSAEFGIMIGNEDSGGPIVDELFRLRSPLE